MYPERFNPFPIKPAPALRVPEEQQLAYGPADKLEVLSHRRNLDRNLKSILEGTGNHNFADLKQRILAIQADITGIDTYLSQTIEAKYYAEHRSVGATAAAKALAIPELLENVLSNLKAADLMQCYGTNRKFRDVIERSEKLQILLFLKPDPNGDSPRFPFESRYIRCTMMNRDGIQILFKTSAGSAAVLPTIGSR